MGQTFREMGWQDREVKVRREELLKVLRENRTRHIQEYHEACRGYRASALKRIEEISADLKAQINSLREGQTVAVVGLHFNLDVPVNHERAYNQIVRMMEMSVDDEITLTASQFGCFVMDDWDWKQAWATSNAKYIGAR